MTEAQARIEQLRTHGWRQGSVLPPSVVVAARASADGRWPLSIEVGTDDWLIVVSHPCDVRNRSVSNEPFVEVLVARPNAAKKADSREVHGKNSRRIHFEGEQTGIAIKLVAHAHERFLIDRLLLADAPPDPQRVVGHPRLGKADRDLQTLITWITKRYQRQAFPDDLDNAASPAREEVNDFLTTQAGKIHGAFVSWVERKDKSPRFHMDFRIVIKTSAVEHVWPKQKAELDSAFMACWDKAPDIEVDVESVQSRAFSIGEMAEGRFEKFDRDWISYAFDPESGPAPGT